MVDAMTLGACPKGFKPQRVRLAVGSGWEEVDAFVFGGVCIHRDLRHDKYWRVTALPSGLAFPGPLMKTDAVHLARRVAKKVDWSKIRRKGKSMEVTNWEKAKPLLIEDGRWAADRACLVLP